MSQFEHQITSKLRPSVLTLLSAGVINYIDAFPGVGKTHHFIHNIAAPFSKHETDYVLVYAAPTIELRNQVYNDMLSADISRHKLILIDSDEDENMRVSDKFKLALSGSDDVDPVPGGSIILLTHECIARSPSNMFGKDRAVLVYDEARACLESQYRPTLSKKLHDYLTQPYELKIEDGLSIILNHPLVETTSISDITGKDGHTCEKVEIWKWYNERIKPPKLKELMSLLPDNTTTMRAAEIAKFLDSIYLSTLDVYVVTKKRNNGTSYEVSNIMVPNRMFSGYARVLIMSAMFEWSQMYQYLKNPPNHVYAPHFKMKDITHDVIPKERVIAILKRFRRTWISYVFDMRRSIHLGEIQKGVVLFQKPDDTSLDRLNLAWSEMHSGSAIPTFKSVYEYMYDKAFDIKAFATKSYRRQEAFLDREMPMYMLANKSVTNYMVDTALHIHQRFLGKNGMCADRMPVVINGSYKNMKLWEQHGLTEMDHRNLKFVTDECDQLIDRVPPTPHGINSFKNLPSFAFLASFKHTPEEMQILNMVIPDHNPSLDRTLMYAIQALCRCSVRNTRRDNKVLWVVTDRFIAEALGVYIRRMVRSVLKKIYPERKVSKVWMNVIRSYAPESLFKSFNEEAYILRYQPPKEKSNKTKNEANSEYSEGPRGTLRKQLIAVYLGTDEGKAWNRYETARKRAKTETKKQAALDKRDKYPTFVQWRDSKEGQVWRDIFTKPDKLKFNLVKAIKDALLKLPKYEDHLDRLRVLAVCKRVSDELKEPCRSWYIGGDFDNNWNTAEKYFSRTRVGWLFRQIM